MNNIEQQIRNQIEKMEEQIKVNEKAIEEGTKAMLDERYQTKEMQSIIEQSVISAKETVNQLKNDIVLIKAQAHQQGIEIQ